MKSWADLPLRALRSAGFACLMVLTLAAAAGFGSAQAAGAPKPSSPRLYVLDCGTISPMDPALFSLKKEEVKGDVSFVSPCYLIVHPKGTLVWDVGQVPDKDIKDDGTEAVVQDILKATRRLATQLAALGVPSPASTSWRCRITTPTTRPMPTRLPTSTWIVQQAEYDTMFNAKETAIRSPETYKDLKDAKRITLNNDRPRCVRRRHRDHQDGAGSHAGPPDAVPQAGAHFGPLLLSGDLYHLPEERALDRVPTFDFDAAMTRAPRKKAEEFIGTPVPRCGSSMTRRPTRGRRRRPEFYD